MEEVIMAGQGGQGIEFIGEILTWAAMFEGKETTWMPSYGPETRGGTANCMVVISDEKIGSPFIECPDSIIVMNEPSLDKFESKVKPGGLVVLNKSLIDCDIQDIQRKGFEVIEVRANDIAQELGNPLVANVVMLGVYLKRKKIVSFENVMEALKVMLSEKKHLIELNEKALQRGWDEAK